MHRYADASCRASASLVRSAQAGAVPPPLAAGPGLDALAVQCSDLAAIQLRRVQLHSHEPAGRSRNSLDCEADRGPCRCTPACWPAATRRRWPTGKPARYRRGPVPTLALRRVSGLVCPRARKSLPHDIMVASGGCGPGDRNAGRCPPRAVRPSAGSRSTEGAWKAVVVQGQFEDQPAERSALWRCRIGHLQRLYRDVLLRHFPHHVAITRSHVGNAIWEALGNYFGMAMYRVEQETPGLVTPQLAHSAVDGKPVPA